MKIVRLDEQSAVPIEDHDSRRFRVVPILNADRVCVVRLHLKPGGLIGRHEATGRQVLVVIEGDALVSGADGSEQEITCGDFVIWEDGESHQTRSIDGLTALAIEGDLTVMPEILNTFVAP